MKTALVLGGGGFIGGHLAHRLMGEGFKVRVVDVKIHTNIGIMMKFVMTTYMETCKPGVR